MDGREGLLNPVFALMAVAGEWANGGGGRARCTEGGRSLRGAGLERGLPG